MSYHKITNLIIKSKSGDKDSLKELIDTYDNLIRKKYAKSWYIRGYDEEDLEQMAKLLTIEVVKKYDINKGANFTAFLDKVLRNNFSSLLSKKENTQVRVSLEKENNEGTELKESLVDDFNLEESYLNKDEMDRLKKAIEKLTSDEKALIYAAYKGHGGLKEYSKTTGISYRVCGIRRNKILDKLRRELDRG